jgi:hypothetical protein
MHGARPTLWTGLPMPTGACAAEKSKNGTPATNEQQDKTAKMKNNRGERDNVLDYRRGDCLDTCGPHPIGPSQEGGESNVNKTF